MFNGHCAAQCCHTALPYAHAALAAHVAYAALPQAAALCCPMPEHCAALSRRTVLPYARTRRCSPGASPRLAGANKPVNYPEPSEAGSKAPPRDAIRPNRTESGFWAPKPSRIWFLDAGTEPNPVPTPSKPNRIRPCNGQNRTEFELGICKPNPGLVLHHASWIQGYRRTASVIRPTCRFQTHPQHSGPRRGHS